MISIQPTKLSRFSALTTVSSQGTFLTPPEPKQNAVYLAKSALPVASLRFGNGDKKAPLDVALKWIEELINKLKALFSEFGNPTEPSTGKSYYKFDNPFRWLKKRPAQPPIGTANDIVPTAGKAGKFNADQLEALGLIKQTLLASDVSLKDLNDCAELAKDNNVHEEPYFLAHMQGSLGRFITRKDSITSLEAFKGVSDLVRTYHPTLAKNPDYKTFLEKNLLNLVKAPKSSLETLLIATEIAKQNKINNGFQKSVESRVSKILEEIPGPQIKAIQADLEALAEEANINLFSLLKSKLTATQFERGKNMSYWHYTEAVKQVGYKLKKGGFDWALLNPAEKKVIANLVLPHTTRGLVAKDSVDKTIEHLQKEGLLDALKQGKSKAVWYISATEEPVSQIFEKMCLLDLAFKDDGVYRTQEESRPANLLRRMGKKVADRMPSARP